MSQRLGLIQAFFFGVGLVGLAHLGVPSGVGSAPAEVPAPVAQAAADAQAALDYLVAHYRSTLTLAQLEARLREGEEARKRDGLLERAAQGTLSREEQEKLRIHLRVRHALRLARTELQTHPKGK